MIFTDNDIKFEKLHWKQFEELCFDLLLKYQFHDLNWRQGGSDKGRDIEAMFTITNSLTGPYPEKWFIECKHYSKGIPVSEISEKVDWALASRVQHLLLITNKYVSQVTQDYLDERRKVVNFKIHIIDEKKLKQRLLAFPDLIVKYFADDSILLVQNMLKQWLFHDILPDIKSLYKIRNIVEPAKLNKDELVFLWFAYTLSDYDEDTLDYDIEPFDFDFLLPFILKNVNCDSPITYQSEAGNHQVQWSSSGYENRSIEGTDINMFIQKLFFNNKLLQIFFKRKERQIITKIYSEKTKRKKQG